VAPRRNTIYKDPTITRHLEILRVSSKIHNEATAILYGYSKFVFYPYYIDYSPAHLLRKLPPRYSNLIKDITLKLWNKCFEYPNYAYDPNGKLWTSVLADAIGPVPQEIWRNLRPRASGVIRTEAIFKCRNLKTLTLEIEYDFYHIAWGGGCRGHRMEETLGLTDLLQIRGLENLRIVDLAEIQTQHPELIPGKEKLEKLLKSKLMKVRRR
jgi:hypothetical protein